MPDTVENVRVVFDSETTSLAQAVDVYADVQKADAQLAEQAQKNADAMQKNSKDMTTLLTGNKKSMDDLSKSFQNLDKAAIGGTYKKVLADMRTQLQLTDAQAKTFYQNLIKNRQQQIVNTEDLEQLQELEGLLAAATEELNAMGGAEDGVTQKGTTLKAQLRAMKEELAQIDDTSDPRFIKLASEAGILEDKIRDTSEQVRLLGSDTRGIDAAIQTVQGLAAAYSVMQVATSALAGDDKELQQSLQQVFYVMQLLQSVQQVSALLDKNSALNIFLIKTLRQQQAVSTEAAATAETELNTATEANIGATEGAAAAQTELNTAMGLNPAAVLILSLTTLIGLYEIFKGKTESLADAQDRLNQKLAFNKDFSDESLRQSKQFEDERIAQLRAAGASEEQIRDEQERRAKQRLDDFIKFNETAIAAGEEAAAKLEQINKTGGYIAIGEADELGFRKVEKVSADYIKNLQETANKGLAISREKDTLQSDLNVLEFNNQAAHNKELADEQKAADEKRKEADAKRLAELKAYQEAQAKLRNEALQPEEILPPADDNSLQLRVDNIIKGVDQIYSRIKLYNSDDRTALLGNLEEQFKKGIITFEQFTAQREQILKDFTARDLDNQISATQAKIEDLKLLGQNTDELQSQLNDLMKQKYDEDYQNYLIANQKKIDAEQKKQQAIQLGQQIVSNFANVFFQSQQDRYNYELSQLDNLRNKKIITEEQYQKRANQLRQQEAENQKIQAFFSMLVQQGPTLLKGFQTGGFAGIAAAASLFFGLLSLVQGTKVPQFAEGVIGLQGPGTEKSDSIPAMLSKNESVMTAEATKAYGPALQAMNDLKFDEFIRNKYSGYFLPEAPVWQSTNTAEIDYDKLGESVARHVGKLSDIPGNEIRIDEHGVYLMVKRENELTEFRNKRYSTS